MSWAMRNTDLLLMSQTEVNRLEILQAVAARRMSQLQAAEVLGLTTRQVRRLLRAYEARGAAGLVSKKRGKQSNNRLDEQLRTSAIALVQAHYADFGPTFANEKLREQHGLQVSRETLRTWMTDAGLWLPRARRRRIHQPRHRRECFGELVQIDGSPHAWFEDRGPPCTLLV